MIKYIVTLFAVLSMLSEMYAQEIKQASASGPVNGFVASWNFNEGHGSLAKESSGKDCSGKIYNAKWTGGTEGSALEFNGEDAYVDCDNNDLLNLKDAITVEIWIKPEMWVAEDCAKNLRKKQDIIFPILTA